MPGRPEGRVPVQLVSTLAVGENQADGEADEAAEVGAVDAVDVGAGVGVSEVGHGPLQDAPVARVVGYGGAVLPVQVDVAA